MLAVACTPIGPTPTISPTSLPSFSAECTHAATSSRPGCLSTPSIAAFPTPPVAHWITRSRAKARPPSQLALGSADLFGYDSRAASPAYRHAGLAADRTAGADPGRSDIVAADGGLLRDAVAVRGARRGNG